VSVTVTDMFAGAGGSSTGMTQVPGITVVMAANHWRLACEVHNTNHPDTDHAAVDLHQEDPTYFPRTDVLWASPECTKWSQANGTKRPAIEEGLFEDPLSDDAATRSRLLMFDVLRFAEHHRYRAMIVENVVDIATQEQYRLAWQVWRQQLRALGYRFRVVSLNSMHAQAHGLPAPQSRDRIYIVCWREGERAPDVERALRPRAYCPKCDATVEAVQSWKNGRTVGRYRQTYLYVHGSCGTVVEPGWLPAAAAIDWSIPGEPVGDRLSEKTRARIAAGIARYWGPLHIEAAGNQYDAADPKHPQHGDPNAYFRAWPVQDVLRTLHTQESKALVVPVEGRDGKDARLAGWPLRTQTTRLESALAHAPFVAEMYGTSTARPVTEPAGTFTAGGNHHALVTRHYGIAGGHPARHTTPSSETLRTLTGNAGNMSLAVDPHALVHRNNTGGAEMTTPVFEELRTITTTGHQSLIRAGTPSGRPHVTPADMRAALELVPDVLFRMFQPHEVAAGMAFPGDYAWDVVDPDKGRPATKRNLVKMAGNAVTPPAARDLMATVAAALTGEEVAA
jgi:DNA (cytosine-5)-methyltransferase 1